MAQTATSKLATVHRLKRSQLLWPGNVFSGLVRMLGDGVMAEMLIREKIGRLRPDSRAKLLSPENSLSIPGAKEI
jgi:hypothetical protein